MSDRTTILIPSDEWSSIVSKMYKSNKNGISPRLTENIKSCNGSFNWQKEEHAHWVDSVQFKTSEDLTVFLLRFG